MVVSHCHVREQRRVKPAFHHSTSEITIYVCPTVIHHLDILGMENPTENLVSTLLHTSGQTRNTSSTWQFCDVGPFWGCLTWICMLDAWKKFQTYCPKWWCKMVIY